MSPSPTEGPAVSTTQPTVPTDVTVALYDALLTAYNYVALIRDGKRPAITDHARQVAAERLERIDGALADAGEYISAARTRTEGE